MPTTRLQRTRAGARADAASVAGAVAEHAWLGGPGRPPAVLVLLNESTKFVVSGAAFCVLLWHRNAAVSVALFGSILASLAGKLLKRLLAHARPVGARKADPGMPSSHAVSLGYLSCYAALSCSGVAERLTLQTLGVLLTTLRVVLGYHTVPQVVVGYALGSGSAAAVHTLAAVLLLPALNAAPQTLAVLYGATAMAVLAFAAVSSKSWATDCAALLTLLRSPDAAR